VLTLDNAFDCFKHLTSNSLDALFNNPIYLRKFKFTFFNNPSLFRSSINPSNPAAVIFLHLFKRLLSTPHLSTQNYSLKLKLISHKVSILVKFSLNPLNPESVTPWHLHKIINLTSLQFTYDSKFKLIFLIFLSSLSPSPSFFMLKSLIFWHLSLTVNKNPWQTLRSKIQAQILQRSQPFHTLSYTLQAHISQFLAANDWIWGFRFNPLTIQSLDRDFPVLVNFPWAFATLDLLYFYSFLWDKSGFFSFITIESLGWSSLSSQTF